ncbi:hypothetical protein K2X85_18345 [bacterium]|nr:hypothetical protein [bacterium]
MGIDNPDHSKLDYESIADQELVRQYRNGDAEAIGELYCRYAERLVKMVHKKLAGVPHRERFEPTAIFQSGFRSFLSGISKPDFDPDHWNIAALLTTIVNCKKDSKLRKGVPDLLSDENIGKVKKIMVPEGEDPFDLDELDLETRDVIDTIMTRLSSQERSVISTYLDFEKQYTRDDIAARCSVSTYQVSKTIERFKYVLRQMLGMD